MWNFFCTFRALEAKLGSCQNHHISTWYKVHHSPLYNIQFYNHEKKHTPLYKSTKWPRASNLLVHIGSIIFAGQTAKTVRFLARAS